MSNVKTPTVLAFDRKLDVSDGLFYAGNWENRGKEGWETIPVREKAVRGTISNWMKTSKQDPAKMDAAVQSPNLQTVDIAALPDTADTLKINFTLRVLGGTGKPSACNDYGYMAKLKDIVDEYNTEHGFGILAERYAQNIANGRFLWRNRIGVEDAEIHVSRIKKGEAVEKWVFDAHKFSLKRFGDNKSEDFKALVKTIEEGLTSEDNYVLLDITAYSRFGRGQEVFPSQELSLDKSNVKGTKSKLLYTVEETAAMHSQKIGNAIRTIDTWYPEADELEQGPIAVEPYGSVTSMGKAFRQPKIGKKDFYNLLDNWMEKDKKPEEEQQHYIMAVFVRGGVFGKGKEK
ncbi:type I-F CRISPR-associated protein Csy3 [Limisalsivibrio acetivorans]|uniref:type I-F CRISPR-associated protein Csy3 n=1 Tax=Limisalsivibrio acetivorans TaxID=1304888 RepID=UPI0003B4418B|nr:type I-F CRISPR-associated protein Csy3 [Limisalsivibrio acetivorans]